MRTALLAVALALAPMLSMTATAHGPCGYRWNGPIVRTIRHLRTHQPVRRFLFRAPACRTAPVHHRVHNHWHGGHSYHHGYHKQHCGYHGHPKWIDDEKYGRVYLCGKNELGPVYCIPSGCCKPCPPCPPPPPPPADTVEASVQLTPDQETVPPDVANFPNAGADALVEVNPDNGEIKVNGNFIGLSGVPTGAHLHAPALAGEDAPVILPLDVQSSIRTLDAHDGAAGTFSGDGDLSEDDLENVLTGKSYLNLHTELNPDGEVRGQVDFPQDDDDDGGGDDGGDSDPQ